MAVSIQRDYYVNKDEPTLEIMKAYREHIVKMFRLFGFSEQAARDRMERILSLENRIAETSLSATELRDVEANYNKMSVADFRKTYPAFPLDGLMKAKGINEKYYQHLVLGQPKFMAGLNAILKDINVDRPRKVHRLHEVRTQLPRRCHHRPAKKTAHY